MIKQSNHLIVVCGLHFNNYLACNRKHGVTCKGPVIIYVGVGWGGKSWGGPGLFF